MGGGQANKQQAAQSFAGSTAGAGASQGLSQQGQQNSQALYNTLWGTPDAGNQGGALTKFLDPNSLNVAKPTGSYAQQYTNARQAIDTGTDQALATSRREAANRGFGAGSPSGMGEKAALEANLSRAGQTGEAFTAATQAQQQQALQNFWNAANMASSSQQSNQGNAISAQQGANQTYSQLYGTSGQYHQGILGNLIGAGGAVGSAAAGKPRK